MTEIKQKIEKIWQNSSEFEQHEDIILEALRAIDSGLVRVAEPSANGWRVNEWVKHAILLYFKIAQTRQINWALEPENSAGHAWVDKVPLKFAGWQKSDFLKHSIRAAPGAIVRHGAFVGKNVVLMPSFVNIGAHIGDGCMIDAWATVGSCAQIGKNCHISGGAGIGGVLEPASASPVIIEDDCFIGARSEIAEGVVVGRGSVISMGVFLSKSTKIVDRETGEIFTGHVPANSVVIPGSLSSGKKAENGMEISTYAAIIVKKADEKTRAKTATNELLRKKSARDG